jgi:hypothetical protein
MKNEILIEIESIPVNLLFDKRKFQVGFELPLGATFEGDLLSFLLEKTSSSFDERQLLCLSLKIPGNYYDF